MTIDEITRNSSNKPLTKEEQSVAYNNIISQNISYEQKLNALANLGTIKIYTDKDNLAIRKELNKGMYNFCLDQNSRDAGAAIESKTTIINR